MLEFRTFYFTFYLCLFFEFFCSKFVFPGSVRVDVQISSPDLEATAFLTPSKQVVLVVMNMEDASTTVKISDVMPGGGGGKKQAMKFTALAHSIQTFIYT